MEKFVREIAGLSISTFQSIARGDEFNIDGKKGIQELQIAKRWQLFSSNSDESDFDFQKLEGKLQLLAGDRRKTDSLQNLLSAMDRYGIPSFKANKAPKKADAFEQPTLKRSLFRNPQTPAEYRNAIKSLMKKAASLRTAVGSATEQGKAKIAEDKLPKSSETVSDSLSEAKEELIEVAAECKFLVESLHAKIKLLRHQQELAEQNSKNSQAVLEAATKKTKRGMLSWKDLKEQKSNTIKATEKLLLVQHELAGYEAVAADLGLQEK